MTVEPVRDVRNHFSDIIGRVEVSMSVSRSRATDAR
jgi:antitoxin (DNA-binding transcriptional repressor) of toxin-antitoxin stability system